ncbi:adenylate/guanylate cyclase domain-containing protein [Lusitaniella coriacea LEGE 07157]|uniref:Adenylate cyclase n=1 Tax=Lusitaniella coriacea LEGE 07157 TaxID=945747 RepID=A0A8J7DT50_9CYAN|nr:adenylate/guanylate cyclase domain-containing protein [Lusitaniella coriacea]MBE9115342.1 adenylate/guanylate cyclase domain-containing protein [Lusitaniella coriacea LEGE 07157]
MRNFFPIFTLFQARLSRYIVLWVFASIIVIEFIILIPSYFAEEKRQLEKLESISEATVDSIKTLTQQEEITSNNVKAQLEQIVYQSKVIRGIAIYTTDGKLIQTLGESPQLSFSDLRNSDMLHKRNSKGNRYDVGWSNTMLPGDWILIIRHDASEVQTKLNFFILRIAVLVLIISAFVTSVTMIVLGATVIVPILRLRDNLQTAGYTLSQDRTDCELHTISEQRKDELGEVMRAFQEMFDRVSREISRRKESEEKLRIEQEKAENLLLNILPQPIAEQLKEKQSTIAKGFSEVTILFADIVGFTELSAKVEPEELVSLLNKIFSAFDCLTEKHGLEKIKTIGDSYMVAAGLPIPQSDHADAIADMALDMQKEIYNFPILYGTKLRIRIGINTGPVVAGVIGTKKFIYDLWGDAVNVASRMESQGLPDCIQVTEETYQRLQTRYHCKERGYIKIKGKGLMQTYLLLSKKAHSEPSP